MNSTFLMFAHCSLLACLTKLPRPDLCPDTVEQRRNIDSSYLLYKLFQRPEAVYEQSGRFWLNSTGFISDKIWNQDKKITGLGKHFISLF